MKALRLLILLTFILTIVICVGIGKISQLENSKILINENIIFTLKAGTGRFMLGAQLYKAKIIDSPIMFQFLLFLKPKLSHFKAGTYRFIPGMSVYKLLQLLNNGKEMQFPLRFIEGMRLIDYLRILRGAPYIQHTLENDSYLNVAEALNIDNLEHVEGWFWPDTWLYTANTKDIIMLKRAYNRMVQAVKEVWNNRSENLPYKNQNQLVTMASIVEKEASVINERNKIASVFVNRLRIGMRLQTDPTVIYCMGASYNGRISRKDLKTLNVYNTYMFNGLPPGPIAIPSQASLNAVAHPAKTSYLYFVTDGKGRHIFNTNLANHNQSVQNYLKLIKEKNAR